MKRNANGVLVAALLVAAALNFVQLMAGTVVAQEAKGGGQVGRYQVAAAASGSYAMFVVMDTTSGRIVATSGSYGNVKQAKTDIDKALNEAGK